MRVGSVVQRPISFQLCKSNRNSFSHLLQPISNSPQSSSFSLIQVHLSCIYGRLFQRGPFYTVSLCIKRMAVVAGGSNGGGEGELSIGVESCGTAMM